MASSPRHSDAFESSNRIESRAGTLIRLGQCREANQQLASAWSAYKDALNRVKDPRKKDFAVARVTAIEPRLSYLTVLVPDESRVDGLEITRNGKPVDPGVWNRAIPVDGGDYVVSGSAPGHEVWSTDVTVPVELGKISVEVPKFKELVKLVERPDEAGPSGAVGGPTPPLDRPGPFTTRRKLAIGVAGGGVGMILLGGLFGAQAKGLQDDAYALCPQPAMCAMADAANDKIEAGRSKALLANIGYGAGAALLAGAAVLWFTGAPESPEARVSVIPRVGGDAGVDVLVRF